ncbi:MAG: sulfate/molybdate ABC transporter ATP-binding protein [Lachnospiraceae bacterium]|jgi:molybdate transport system ATP-binding protein
MALQVQIEKEFSGFTLQVDFEMNGGCLGILGASGCGKSMTLQCIAGIEKPDKGRIVLNDRVLFDSDKKINLPVQKRNVGFLFQNYALFPTMTVGQNLTVALQGKKEAYMPQVQEQIRRFQLEGLEDRYPSQLSGGQQQRVALARMLLQQPEIIMLDEPFSALDGFLKDTLQLEMLELLQEYGKDVLLVSHSRDEIFKFCSRMVLLADGKDILQGKTEEVFANPRKMEAARLTGCKNISAAEKINEYEIYAKDWHIRLHTAEKVSDDIRYVGLRGHRLIPSREPEGENVMRICSAGYTETPFEKQYLFRNAEFAESKRIWWMQKKDKFIPEDKVGLPPYMIFPKEELMLLS